MTNLQISGISKEDFAVRVKSALESAMQSPIVKRKDAIVNKAMVHLLHGDNGAGQNEHNLNQFFTKSTKSENVVFWQGIENYSLESDLDDMTTTHEASSLVDVELKLFTSVIDYLSSHLEHSIRLDYLEEYLLAYHGITPFSNHFDINDTDQESMEGYEVSDLIIETTKTSPLCVVRTIFEFITKLSNVRGRHIFKEMNVPNNDKQTNDEKIEVYVTTVHHFELEEEFSDEPDQLSFVETLLDRKIEKQEKRIETIMYNHLPEGDMAKQYMLNHSLVEDLLQESDKCAANFEGSEPSDIFDWILSQVDVMDLTDFIKDLSHGTIEIKTSTEYI